MKLGFDSWPWNISFYYYFFFSAIFLPILARAWRRFFSEIFLLKDLFFNVKLLWTTFSYLVPYLKSKWVLFRKSAGTNFRITSSCYEYMHLRPPLFSDKKCQKPFMCSVSMSNTPELCCELCFVKSMFYQEKTRTSLHYVSTNHYVLWKLN